MSDEHRAQRRRPERVQTNRDRTTLALHLTLLVAVSAWFESLFVHQGLNLLDEGWIYYTAKQLYEGGTLYEDVFFVFPPAHALPAWIGYALDPPGLIVTRWIYAMLNVALCISLYLLGRCLMRPRYALIGALLLALNSASSHASHYLFAYRYVGFSVLALLAFHRNQRNGDTRWLAAAGALAGIGLCFRLTPTFAVSVAIGLGILASTRDWRVWVRDGGSYAAGLLTVSGPVIAWYAWTVGPSVLWSEVVQRPVEMTALQSLPVPDLFLPVWSDRAQIEAAFVALEFRIAIAVAAGYLAWVLWGWQRDLRAGHAYRNPLLLAVSVFAAVYLTRAFGRACSGHLTSAIPPILLLMGHLLGSFDQGARRWLPPRWASGIAVTAGIVLLAGWTVAQRSDQWIVGTLGGDRPIPETGGRVFRDAFMPHPVDLGVRWINRATKPGDVVLDLSASPMLHVLTGRRGPGLADIVMPGTFRDQAEEARFLERVIEDPPDFVLTPAEPFDGREERGFAQTAPQLTAWIEKNYEVRQRSWAFVGWGPRATKPSR